MATSAKWFAPFEYGKKVCQWCGVADTYMDGAHYLYVEIDRQWDKDPEHHDFQKLVVHPVLAHLCANVECERARHEALANTISALLTHPVKVETTPFLFFNFLPLEPLQDLGKTDPLQWTKHRDYRRGEREFRWAPYNVAIAGVAHGNFSA